MFRWKSPRIGTSSATRPFTLGPYVSRYGRAAPLASLASQSR